MPGFSKSLHLICSWKISCVKIHNWPLRFLRIRGAIFWKGYFIALTLPLISILSIRLSLLMSAFMQSGITNWWLSVLLQKSKLKSFKSVWIDFLLHIYSAVSPILFSRFSGPPKHENISHGYEKKRLRDDAIYVFWGGIPIKTIKIIFCFIYPPLPADYFANL